MFLTFCKNSLAMLGDKKKERSRATGKRQVGQYGGSAFDRGQSSTISVCAVT